MDTLLIVSITIDGLATIFVLYTLVVPTPPDSAEDCEYEIINDQNLIK